MANGAPLCGGERKKENETYKEREREREGQRHQISLLIIESSDTTPTPGKAGLTDQPGVLTI